MFSKGRRRKTETHCGMADSTLRAGLFLEKYNNSREKTKMRIRNIVRSFLPRVGWLVILVILSLAGSVNAVTLINMVTPSGTQDQWNELIDVHTQAHQDVSVELVDKPASDLRDQVMAACAAGGVQYDVLMVHREWVHNLAYCLENLSSYDQEFANKGIVAYVHGDEILGALWPHYTDWVVCISKGSQHKKEALDLVVTGCRGAIDKVDDFYIWLRFEKFEPSASLEDRALEYVEYTQLDRVHIFLQFYNIPSLHTRTRLEERGIQLLGYVPNNCWFASIPTGSEHREFLEELFGEGILRWADVILPAARIDPQYLEEGAHDWSRNPDGTFNVVVILFEDITDESHARDILKQYGSIRSGPGMVNDWVLAVDEQKLVALQREDVVEWIEEIGPVPVDKNDGLVANIKASNLWANPYNLDGNNVDIGMWEVGGCPDSNSAKGTSTYAGHDDFYDTTGTSHLFVQEGTPSEHATEVAGVLGGSGYASNRYSNGGTANQWKGVAPGAEIYAYTWDVKVAEEHKNAINRKGIDISHNSWGWAGSPPGCNPRAFDTYNSESRKYDAIVTGIYTTSIPVVFAAGNEQSCQTGGWHTINRGGPTAKNTITVGAINSDNNTLTASSSLGPTKDGRIKPDLVAPGCQAGGDGGIKTPTWSATAADKYACSCGTSYAAPAVSGSIALLIQEHRATIGGDPLPSTVKALLICTAQDRGNTGPDYKYGFGAIDIKAAVDKLKATTRQFTTGNIRHGKTQEVTITVPNNAKKLRVTLVWDDKPAVLPVSKALVNDLDLFLIDPKIVSYKPWHLDPANPGNLATRGWDFVNTAEQVEVDKPVAGTWTLYVSAFKIPDRKPQSYTLVWDVK